MSDKGICRTAQDTPGLLKTHNFHKYVEIKISPLLCILLINFHQFKKKLQTPTNQYPAQPLNILANYLISCPTIQ